MRTIVVDYNRIGLSSKFWVALFAEERNTMSIGERLVVVGDDVPERQAILTALSEDGRQGEFCFCD